LLAISLLTAAITRNGDMKILMLTNTYRPVVSGVTKSVLAFEDQYRQRGHEVLVIAPEFDETKEEEPTVIRLPAFQHYNGSEFALPIPAPMWVSTVVEEFQPDIVHAHHPFFLGNTAMRLARARNLPLVFTHHTMYEQYTHYTGSESPAAVRFVGSLSAGYANLCDAVIAPSQSVTDMLRERGVEARIEVIPTGVDVSRFARGDGVAFRASHGIPPDAFVVGYVGRLAQEKNLHVLAQQVARFLEAEPRAFFLAVGAGPAEAEIRDALQPASISDRWRLAGVLDGQELIDAYHALDVFAFASQSETQGMVVTEAMAAGVPVVALDGPGVRDVVRDRVNGRLIPVEKADFFPRALQWVASRTGEQKDKLLRNVRSTAERLSISRTAEQALALYESLIREARSSSDEPEGPFSRTRRRIDAEWRLLSNVAHAAGCAMDPAGSVTAVAASGSKE
jgi:1,2-diacylglycerol 3-alpha-glucosyltransferase